jgi:P27 family predicted phage terminase small subunit
MGGRGSGGHNRKSTERKKLEGNRGHRKLNQKEPKPKPGAPAMPPYVAVSRFARAEWNRLVPLLLDLKVLTTADGPALGGLCSAFSQLVMAENAIQKYGLMVADLEHETGVGVVRVNPAVRIKSDALRHLRAFCSQFGLDPASRSKLQIDNDSTQDSMDDFFSGKAADDVVQ